MKRVYNPEVNTIRRRRSSSKLLFIFILLLVALVATNPKKEDFTAYVVNGTIENVESVGFKNFVNLFNPSTLNSVIGRDNYIFLSVYYFDVGKKGPKYIGFFKRVFIEI